MSNRNRRHFLRGALASMATLALAGCDRLSRTRWFPKTLRWGEDASRVAQTTLTGGQRLAREFPESAISPTFRANGTTRPTTEVYQRLLASDFGDFRLQVDGLVERPLSLSLAELTAMPSRTQITRHDCVEGWSAIGMWTGVPLSTVLDAAGAQSAARYVVFHCADSYGVSPSGEQLLYYESIDLDDARHPQTILAYELNRQRLPVENGAPLRLRVERQLGYKMAKYILRIELVESFAGMRGGQGGYWEDNGYAWYAGI